jgi:glycosyltransferase involved in cell wall biosynthesis
VGGVTEIITDKVTGLLHRPGDDADLAEKILSLLSNRTLGESLVEAGRRLVENRFTIRQFAASIARLYREAIGHAHGR